MSCRVNGLPGSGPRALSIGQTQARVRMVTTPSRIVAHALDLSPLPGPGREYNGGEERDNPGLKGAMQQVFSQLGLPNRLFSKQVYALVSRGVRKGDVGPEVVGTEDKYMGSWSNVHQALLSHLGSAWFGTKGEGQDTGEGVGYTTKSSGLVMSGPAMEVPEEQVAGNLVVEGTNEPQKRPQLPDIWKYLKPVPLSDVKVVRVMASLSDLTYFVAKVTPKALFRRHKMELVASSLMCKEVKNESKEVKEAIAHGDGMAVGYDLESTISEKTTELEKSNIVVATMDDEVDAVADGEMQTGIDIPSTRPIWLGPRNLAVKMALSMGTAANGMYSQAMAQVAGQVYQAMLVGQTAVNLTLAQVLSLVQAALAFGNIGGSLEDTPSKPGKCPTEWFVCDHADSKTRIFCIQGSDNFESWQTNLTFDPVPFEDEALGVRIHRGVYGAAEVLYELFVPLVREFLQNNPGGKISMTGHSLGGSLATVLILMLVHRGVLPPEAVGSVHTFGAAACFCEAASCGGDCANCGHSCAVQPGGCGAHTPSQGLLEKLNLADSSIVNVVMNKDIVPRAFACDYSPVAALLRNVGPGFRDLCCLQHDRSLLYSFLGDVVVLQPDEKRTFVKEGEGYHPQLPEGAGLFRITDTTKGLVESPEWKRAGPVGDCVNSCREAVLSLMDNPHPLEILADAGAYGELGTISRYHNPMHYKKAVGSVLAALRVKDLEHSAPEKEFGLSFTNQSQYPLDDRITRATMGMHHSGPVHSQKTQDAAACEAFE